MTGAKSATTLFAWVGLSILNLTLLGLSRYFPLVALAAASRNIWNFTAVIVGVVVFPVLACFLLFRFINITSIRRWKPASLIMFTIGASLVASHLFLAKLWMIDRTDFVPGKLTRCTETVLSYGYTLTVPGLIGIVWAIWVLHRREGTVARDQ